LEVVKVAEGGITVVSFFGLSSSLKANYLMSRRREDLKIGNFEK
jgi:hypothetical protein